MKPIICIYFVLSALSINCYAQFKVYKHKSTPKFSIVTVHGLNNKPDVLVPMGVSIDAEVFRIGLEGHYEATQDERYKKGHALDLKTWGNTLEKYWNESVGQAGNKELSIIAYSTGAALATLLTHQGKVKPHKMVLIAPAIKIKWYSRIIKGLFMFDKFIVKSLSPKEYQASEGTPINMYKTLFKNINAIDNLEIRPQNLPETLVILAKDDELVDSDKVSKWIKKNNLTHWKIIWAKKCEDSQISYNHLIVDEMSLGKECFKNLSKKISDFLEK